MGECRKFFFHRGQNPLSAVNYYIQSDAKLIFVNSIFSSSTGSHGSIPSVQREVTVAQRKWLDSNKNQKVAALEFFNTWRYISQLYCAGCMEQPSEFSMVMLISSMEKKLDSFKTLDDRGLEEKRDIQASK